MKRIHTHQHTHTQTNYIQTKSERERKKERERKLTHEDEDYDYEDDGCGPLITSSGDDDHVMDVIADEEKTFCPKILTTFNFYNKNDARREFVNILCVRSSIQKDRKCATNNTNDVINAST